MAKIFRRTKQRYQQGTNGSVSSALDQITGTLAQVFNAQTGTNDGDRNKVYAPGRSGGWTSADLGRLIRLANTPPTSSAAGINRHDDWLFPIIEIVSSNIIRLGNGCCFQDAGTNINWTLMAACQFEATSADFPVDSVTGAGPVVGQWISIPKPASSTGYPLTFCPWQVVKRISATQLLISDWTGRITAFPVSGQTGLTWYLHDRQAYNYRDLFTIMHAFNLDCGWTITGSQAKGTIQIPAGGGADITDGQFIRIWDGTQKLTFEFDSGGGVSGGHIAVVFTGGDSQSVVAATLTAVLNSQSGFKVSTINEGSGLLRLFATKTNNDTTAGGTNTISGLPWYYGSNPNFTADANEPIVLGGPGTMNITATGLTGGQNRGQFRGRNDGPSTDGLGSKGYVWEDSIFFSEGEGGYSNHVDPKRMWVRMVKYVTNFSLWNGRNGWSFAMFQSWQPDQAGGSYNWGNGTNPLMYPEYTSNNGAHLPFATPTAAQNLSGWVWNYSDSTIMVYNNYYSSIAPNNLGIPGGDLMILDYALFGDKDEIHLYVMMEGVGSSYVGYGAVKEIAQNPHRFLVREAVASGAGNKTINVGPVNPQTLARPYKVGDAIQISGKGGTYSSPERVESSTIVSFGTGGPDGSDYTITLASPIAASAGYAIGAILGEEAEPIFMYAGPNTGSVLGGTGAYSFRMHSSAFYNDATYRDYSGPGTPSVSLGYGFAAEDGLAGLGNSSFEDVDPNRRSGRSTIGAVVCRNYARGEFRGRMRWYNLTSDRAGVWQFLRDRSGNWYFLLPYCLRQNSAELPKIAFGPLSYALAKPF